MLEHQQAVAKILRDDPNIQNVMSSIGGFGPNNTGRVFCRLRPRGERLDANSIIQELRPKLARIPGISVYLQNPPVIRIGGQLTKSLYQFTLSSTDINELKQWAPQLESRLRDNSLFQDATTDLQITNPEITVDINRDRALALGVTADAIENTLFSSYSNKQVSTIYTPSNQYFVIMELQPKDQRDPVQLSKLYVHSNSGQLVPLDAVAKLRRTVGPLTVNHTGQLPSVTVSFNLRPGIALGQAVDEINRTIRDMRLPMTIMTSFQGSAQAFETSTKTLWILLIIAVLVIYMVLGILYESFIHPLTILSGLPSAGFGALLTLVLFKVDLSLYAFVGLIMLIGIVKKNAIMMIDFALDVQRNEGKSPADAIYQGCLVRFRPIMMTTAAALLGSLPIALGWGSGAEARRPLGLAVVGGLLFSQLITLYLTPVVYIYMEAIQRFLTRRKGQMKPKKRAAGKAVVAPHSATPQPVGD
jgi:HAE1 family hydrophobic/amphiphilic exporter-1